MSDMVNIAGLDKAAVLATLFNASAPGGMGFFQAQHGPSVMTTEDARQLIEDGGSAESGIYHGNLSYDYLFGRPLKINLEGDEFDPWGFDRDNGGTGTAQRLIEKLRETSQVDSPELSEHRHQLLDERSAGLKEFVRTPSGFREDGSYLMGGDDVAEDLTRQHDEQVKRFRNEW